MKCLVRYLENNDVTNLELDLGAILDNEDIAGDIGRGHRIAPDDANWHACVQHGLEALVAQQGHQHQAEGQSNKSHQPSHYYIQCQLAYQHLIMIG